MQRSFLYWFLLLLVMVGIAYFSFEAGFFDYIWHIDSSKLCFVILTLFTIAYLKLGQLCFVYDYKGKRIELNDLDLGYEAADMSMALGMLGTVIGFIVMSSSFTSIDFSNIENIKDLFKLATSGMSTALYTTAFGLVSNIVLRAVYFLFQKDLGL